MRVAVDKDRCAGHAQCCVLCPSVFDSDEFGYAVLIGDGVVSPEDQSAAADAIEACPERAISRVPEGESDD